MFNLFDMMQRSQDGSAVENMARQFGLTPRQAENAVDVLLPAFTLALQRHMQNPQLWPNLMAAVQPPPAPPSNPFEAASRAFTPEGMRQGAEFMTNLFGSPDLSKQIAAQGAAASGLPATMLQQMLPAMGAMLMSGMLKTFSQQGLAGVMEAMSRSMTSAQTGAAMAGFPGFAQAGQPQAMAPYVEMFSRMLRAAVPAEQEPAAPPPPPPPPEPKPEAEPAAKAAEPLQTPNPFDPTAMAAFFSQMMSSFAPAAPSTDEEAAAKENVGSQAKAGVEPAAAVPGSPPLRSHAKAVGAKPQASAAPKGSETDASAKSATASSPAKPAEQPAPTASDEGLHAFEALVQTGREVQEQHMRNLQNLFAQMFPDGRAAGGGGST